MNKELLDYIRYLSKSDKKTLSQKALKATEELGELAKVVLPYDNAFATTHRFVNRTKILEEVADVMLTVLSIAYDLDMSDDEIDQMISHKMKKWAALQSREGDVKYPIPYEMHITVDALHNSNLETFKKICSDIKVKPILLDLHLSDNAVMKDLMTSSTFIGNNRTAYEELKRISNALQSYGYKVLREKIETIPWHQAAPSRKHDNYDMPPNCYFECHLNVLTSNSKISKLNEVANKYNAKKSTNIFKQIDFHHCTIMVTYRSYDKVYEEFAEHLSSLKKELIDNNFTVEKEIVEFSIYDTKISHDASWINSSS